MEVTDIKKCVLEEKEIKEVLRKHLIDKLGIENIKEEDIKLDADVDQDQQVFDFKATIEIQSDYNHI